MSIAGIAFVTPHAIKRFQEKIAPLNYNDALFAIIKGLSKIKCVKLTENGSGTFKIRVKEPFEFRAIIDPRSTGDLPVVSTILKSGKPGRNRKLYKQKCKKDKIILDKYD